MFQPLNFRPLPGLSSPHLQMLFANYTPPGDEPPSSPLIIRLRDGDQLSCQVSIPENWQPNEGTIVLVHGLGGSHRSAYMIRLARKFYLTGQRVVRINLRGCGSGVGLNQKTYTSGDSDDVATVLQLLKMQEPLSAIQLLGFSLGGNIILKLAGEWKENAAQLVERMIAICPPLDLQQTLTTLCKKRNHLYQRYYLHQILKQGKRWANGLSITTVQEFDEKITAPLWGYSSAREYYETCSSHRFLSSIRIPCDLLFAADDPFIDHTALNPIALSETTRAFLARSGAHMSFIGREKNGGIFWLDQYLLEWASSPFKALTPYRSDA